MCARALGLGGDERIEDGRQQRRLNARSLIDDPKGEVIALHYGVDGDWRTGWGVRAFITKFSSAWVIRSSSPMSTTGGAARS